MTEMELVEGAEAVELAGSIFDPDRVVDLEKLYQSGREESARGAAYKTVATFAGLTNRRLWLKEGNFPSTDGHEILAPFKSPYFYRIVEHELAHILFQSSIEGKVEFIRLYVEQVRKHFESKGQDFQDHQAEHLGALLSVVIGILEDVRVESLWALLYPGSFAEMQEMHKHMVAKGMKNANMSPAAYLCVVSARVKAPPGPYDYLREPMEEAMRKVERRGFAATLAVSKWLMQQFVSEMSGQRNATQAQSLAQQALQKLRSRAPPVEQLEDHTVPDSVEAPPSPPDPALAGARVDAFRKLLEVMDVPSSMFSWRNDVTQGKFPTADEKKRGKAAADFVSKMDTKDEAKLEEFLASSESRMAEVVERALKTLGGHMEQDGWITKNAFGKVNLKDVRGHSKLPERPEDRATTLRLRSIFYRVLGRRKHQLHETGSDLDVAAYIEGLFAAEPVPCFRAEERGRGFKALVLVDRSLSMMGLKTEQAERACRTLEAAMKFPFVDFRVWGFQSFKNGEVDITRFAPGGLDFDHQGTRVAGGTPLHLALRIGVRFMEQGNEAKQIILITDGAPSHALKSGNRFATRTLMGFAREEIRRARRIGMNVTGVIIGREMKDKELSFMLGPPTNWRRMDAERLGDGLVQLVSTSFVKYLRNG